MRLPKRTSSILERSYNMNQKIVLLPLDDRPCNAEYPHHIGLPHGMLFTPPKNCLGYKKTPGNFALLKSWLLEEVKDASHLVLSFDQWVYGGLIPSRLHHEQVDNLLQRLALIRDIKTLYPHVEIYGFVMIMRNPFYNSDDEEPDYYAYDGSHIYKSGYYAHKQELLGSLSTDEVEDYAQALRELNPDNLNDYLSRRATNIEVVKAIIDLKIEGLIDYLVIPQDDSSPYGYTKRDQDKVKAYIKSVKAVNIDIYPGADEVGLVLIARAVQHMFKKKTAFRPIYACEQGQMEIPPFEDRPLYQSVASQIQASGSEFSIYKPDTIDLFIHVASRFVDKNDPDYQQVFFKDRPLQTFANDIKNAVIEGKKVALADVAFANGGDIDLVKLLDEADVALSLYAYGGWNTSSNTLGTVIAQAIIFDTFHLAEKQKYFLLHRYYEDVGYMGYVRGHLVENELPKLHLNYFDAGETRGEVSKLVSHHLYHFMAKTLPNMAKHVRRIDIIQPWARMFETHLQLELFDSRKVCLDVGGTNIKGARISQGNIDISIKKPTQGNKGRKIILSNIFRVIDELIDTHVTGIAISSAGDMDPYTGTCTYASDNLRGWTGLNIKEAIEDRYHLLTYVDNDAYCHLNAERRSFAHIKNITLLTFGTGVGGASLINGTLDRTLKTKWGYRIIEPNGRYLDGAKEYGVSEAYLSLRNLLEAIEPFGDKFVVDSLFVDYLKGDEDAIQILNAYGQYLSKLLLLINEEIHPEMIILGGGLVTNQEVIRKIIDPTIQNYAFATYGNNAGMIGAYYLPFEEN